MTLEEGLELINNYKKGLEEIFRDITRAICSIRLWNDSNSHFKF